MSGTASNGENNEYDERKVRVLMEEVSPGKMDRRGIMIVHMMIIN